MRSVHVSKAPAIISIILLLLAIVDGLPYGYFVFLRLIVCASAAYLAVQAHEIEKVAWSWIMGAVAVLFNPVLPLHMDRSVWQLLDLIAAMIFATSIGYIRIQSLRFAWVIPDGFVLSVAIVLYLMYPSGEPIFPRR